MSKIRKSARGQECQIQLYPYCNGNSETVVLCHAPSESKGMGVKSPDWWAAYGCSSCHDIVDGRRMVDDISNDEIFRCLMRGVFRTQKIMFESGTL